MISGANQDSSRVRFSPFTPPAFKIEKFKTPYGINEVDSFFAGRF